MYVTRRELIRLTLSSCLVTALPEAAPAGSPAKPHGKHPRKPPQTHVHVNSGLRHAAHHDPTIALVHSWKEAPEKAKHGFPKAGATVILDYKGNWSFSGLFEPYNPPEPGASTDPFAAISAAIGGPYGRNAALVFALKSSLGYVMTFEAGGWVSKTGYSWNKEGNDHIVKDLWPDVVKGHDWYAAAVFSPVISTLQEKDMTGGSRSEGNSALSDVASVLGTAGTIIATLF